MKRFLQLVESKRFLQLVASASLMAGALAAPISPVAAYPPGQEMTITASRPQVAKGDGIVLTIRNAAPGQLALRLIYTKANGSIGDTTKYFTVGAVGEVKTHSVAMSYFGILKAVATDSTNGQATARVYVPKLLLPATLKVGVQGLAMVRYARPGTVFKFYLPGMLAKKAKLVNMDSRAKIAFIMRRSGEQVVEASVGRIAFREFSILGN